MLLVSLEGTLMDGRSEGLETRQALSPRSGLSREAKEKVRALINTLRNKRTSFEAQGDAAWTLGQIGSIEAAPALLELLRNKRAPYWVRAYAARALGQIGAADEHIIRALSELAEDKNARSDVRNAADKELIKIIAHADTLDIDAPLLIRALRELVGGENASYGVRNVAEKALVKIIAHADTTHIDALLREIRGEEETTDTQI